MDTQRFRDRLLSGRMSRREFNRGLTSVGIAMAMVPVGPRLTRADEQATYYTLGGLAEEGLFQRYIDKYGAMPDTAFWGDEEEALNKLRSGFEPDVTYCGSYSVARWREADVIQPIDPVRLSNWPDLFERLRNVTDAVAEGQQWLAPVGWGTTSVIYRSDLVEIDEESWSLLWDKRYEGRLAMIDGVADAVAGAAIYAGIDPYTMGDAEIARVKDVLTEQRSLLRLYTSDMTSLGQAIASGEIVAAMTWNDVYASLLQQGVPVKYMFQPKEGISAFVSCMVLNKNSAQPDKAYEVMDSVLDPQSGAFWMTTYGYGHANQKAYDLVTDEQFAAIGLPKNSMAILDNGVFQSRMQNEEKIVQMFEAVKSGI
jgi:spermidine/putrescine transport system substrate-binding protein